MKNHKLLKRDNIVACDDAAGNGRIVADACSREQPTSQQGRGNRASRGWTRVKKNARRRGTAGVYVGVITRSGDKPTYGSEALIGRRVELSITAVTVPCSAKTVNLPPSGFLKVYFSL